MTLTIKFLNEMFRQWGDKIDKQLEAYLLATYEEEPFPHVWSEEDLYQQVRRLIYEYEQGILDVSVSSPLERYEALKESYMELLREVNKLHETISSVTDILLYTNNPSIPVKDSVIPF